MPRFRMKSFLISLLAFALLAMYQRYILPPETSVKEQPVKELTQTAVKGVKDSADGTVTKVVDGDTIEVMVDGTKKKIRIIGINTPETVDPRKGVQCFGKEASAYAKSFLFNKTVRLESDPSQTEQDKYGRLLRYVWLDTVDYGKHMIEDGYAHEYTYDIPYIYQTSYKAAEVSAQEQRKGLWADTACAEESL